MGKGSLRLERKETLEARRWEGNRIHAVNGFFNAGCEKESGLRRRGNFPCSGVLSIRKSDVRPQRIPKQARRFERAAIA